MLESSGPLVVVVGQTASGKSALGMDLARRFNGEIICADSRTVYRGMDIGTAKPTAADRAEIRHHLLDEVNPDEYFSAAEFQRLANLAINDIQGRGKLPIVVGGTGLYVDGLVFGFEFLPGVDAAERQRLEALDLYDLWTELLDRGLPVPSNFMNKRHITRAIEVQGRVATNTGLRSQTLVLGLHLDQDVLARRIRDRTTAMVESGFVAEVQTLAARYGWDAPGMQAPGYKAFRGYVEGAKTLDDAKNEFASNDLRLAKRQRTWFKRNNHIRWVSATDQVAEMVEAFLHKNLG